MYITVDQAKEMDCPCGRSNPVTGVKCSGPGCMAWRWGGRLPYAARKRIVPEGVPLLADLEDKARDMEDEAFNAYLEALEKQYRNEPSRPSDCPSTWEYKVDFKEWDGGYFIAWWEPSSDANKRAQNARIGYCGLSGNPYQP